NERPWLCSGSCAPGATFSHGAAGRQGYFGFAAGDSAQGSGGGLEGSGFERPQPGQTLVGQGSGHTVADVAIAVVGASGDDSVSGDYGAAAGGGSEDRERCVHAVVGWQAAFADGDAEVSEAAGSATSAASATSANKAGQRS